MGRFPHCKKWIAEKAPEYPAVEIKRVPGKSPEIHWLNADGDTVETTNVKEKDTVDDIEQYFADRGITRNTPKPELPPVGNRSTVCAAWRRTMVDGTRLPGEDHNCETEILPGAGVGYCECNNGNKIPIAASPHRYTVTCEAVCTYGKVPWQILIDNDEKRAKAKAEQGEL